jgi:6-phosphogluconolactonase
MPTVGHAADRWAVAQVGWPEHGRQLAGISGDDPGLGLAMPEPMRWSTAALLCMLATPGAHAHAAGLGDLEIAQDGDAVTKAAADTLVEVVARAKAEGRVARIALSGGSTPKKLFALLADSYRDRIDWSHVEIFFGDERGVGPAHPDSNYGVAAALWLQKVPLPPSQIHRMRGEAADLGAEASAYERLIREKVGAGAGKVPAFDLVWLGVGPDGHTASLFPGGGGLRGSKKLVIHQQNPAGQSRLSFTGALIGNARRVQFLVSGADKAEVLAQIHGKQGSKLPATLVARRSRGQVQWLVDRAAAQHLPKRLTMPSGRR